MGFFGKITGKVSSLTEEEVNAIKQRLGFIVALSRECELELAKSGNLPMLSEQLIADVLAYVIFLSYADGKIMPAEVEAINSIFGSKLTQSDCEKIGKEIDRVGDVWTAQVPPSFDVLYKYIEATRTEIGEAPLLGMKIVEFYKTIGFAIAHSDSRYDKKEDQAIHDYCMMLMEYLKRA